MNENERRFIRFPAMLLDMDLTDGAKLLYAILADRAALSEKNGLADERGVYIFCTNREICGLLHRSHQKATAMLRELEQAGLIRRVRQGWTRPDKIYVENPEHVCRKSALMNAENRHSIMLKISTHECTKSAPIHTDINQTDSIQTDLSRSCDLDSIRTEIYDNISFYRLKEKTDRPALLEEIAELMVSVCSGNDPAIRIGCREMDGRAVRERLLGLDGDHILYVMECMEGRAIRNRRAYLLTALYKAPDTIDDYYDRQVVRDMPWLNTS